MNYLLPFFLETIYEQQQKSPSTLLVPTRPKTKKNWYNTVLNTNAQTCFIFNDKEKAQEKPRQGKDKDLPAHPHNAGTEHVGFSPTRKALLAPSVKRRGVRRVARRVSCCILPTTAAYPDDGGILFWFGQDSVSVWLILFLGVVNSLQRCYTLRRKRAWRCTNRIHTCATSRVLFCFKTCCTGYMLEVRSRQRRGKGGGTTSATHPGRP